MALKLQTGSDGKLRLKGGKLVVDDGTHACCCGRAHHTPTSCSDCICPGCTYVTFTVHFHSPLYGDADETATVGPQDTGNSCTWEIATSGSPGLGCSGTTNCGSCADAGLSSPCIGLQISHTYLDGSGHLLGACLACFFADLADSCPDAVSWGLLNVTTPTCSTASLTSISCSDAPPP